MNVWCRKFVLALALAVMPLQGVAATLSVLSCHGDAQAHASGTDSHGGHAGNGQREEGSPTGNYHLCCHYTVSAPVVVTLPGKLPDFPVWAAIPDHLHDRYFPEQPQRPPLA